MPRNTRTSSAAAAVSPDDPQPSTSAGPLSFYDDSSDDESGERFVPRGRVLIEDSSDSDLGSDSGDDSDLDYVSHDTSLDEDEPLSAYARRLRERNSPGQPGFRWRKKENVPTRYGFRAQPGVNTPGVDSDSSPLELFSLFFTEELMDMIVRETNRYHRQKPGPSSHMKDWVDTSVSELGVFIGLRMAMGINQKPEQRSYWSTDLFYHSPLFPVTMTRDRFDQLSRYLHVVDNEGSHPPDDRLWKLRPAIEILQRQFSSVFTPPRRITVDESLWKFRGRFVAVTYNPSKRSRFGVKVYKLAASEGPSNGYICAFEIYTGRDRSDIPASQRAVIHLMGAAGLFDKGYDLYTDNWYTSPTLFHYLQSRRTNAIGTVRTNRKFMPTDLQVKARGQVDSRSTPTGMLCLQWRDRRVVTLLSTVHKSEMVATRSRSGFERIKPKVVVDYNCGMKGVDNSDQLACPSEDPHPLQGGRYHDHVCAFSDKNVTYAPRSSRHMHPTML
ncbi:PiggyBac transposable element-derived protein 4 [Penaeus vannamei]|uniref:PiggyBac transposable element-derived protein 4 n=1 Tax=Penaeus vannamei TaxID=6689 RepID=A0A423TN96_PENVA|nr:PiggyBac transposable element-derived protein 4 [Penaeus vannamei]